MNHFVQTQIELSQLKSHFDHYDFLHSKNIPFLMPQNSYKSLQSTLTNFLSYLDSQPELVRNRFDFQQALKRSLERLHIIYVCVQNLDDMLHKQKNEIVYQDDNMLRISSEHIKLSMDLKELSILFGVASLLPNFQPASLIENLEVRKIWQSYLGPTCNFVSTEDFVMMVLNSDDDLHSNYNTDPTEKETYDIQFIQDLFECFFAGQLISPFRCNILIKAFGTNLQELPQIFVNFMINQGIKDTLWIPRWYCEKLLTKSVDDKLKYLIRFSESNVGILVLSYCNPTEKSNKIILHRLAFSQKSKKHSTITEMVQTYLSKNFASVPFSN